MEIEISILLKTRKKFKKNLSWKNIAQSAENILCTKRERQKNRLLLIETAGCSKATAVSIDLKRRVCEYQKNKVFSTKERNPELIYYESYASIELVRKRENSLKKFSSAYVGLLKRIGEK